MPEPTVTETISEMSALSARLRAEAHVMRVATFRQGVFYVVIGLMIVGYISGAFLYVSHFIDTERMATITGDAAIRKSMDMVEEGSSLARIRARQFVGLAENAFVASIPATGRELDLSLGHDLHDAVVAALSPVDQAVVAEIARLPNGRQRVAAAAANPAAAAALFADVRARVRQRPEVQAAMHNAPRGLVRLREHLVRLRDSSRLSASEEAERRLLQVAVSKAGASGTAAP